MKSIYQYTEEDLMMNKYNMFAFGVPFFMVTSVLVVEAEANSGSPSCFANAIRPGFGEESCWFALCSNAGQVNKHYWIFILVEEVYCSVKC